MILNLGRFTELVEIVPDDLDRTLKKQEFSPEVRNRIKKRDNSACQSCTQKGNYGYSSKHVQIHHIIPNGPGTEQNGITLCFYCHRAIHTLLYVYGKWKYTGFIATSRKRKEPILTRSQMQEMKQSLKEPHKPTKEPNFNPMHPLAMKESLTQEEMHQMKRDWEKPRRY